MLQKKVCMLGGFAVGKTSLVARCVQGVFSDKYLSTVGVKIDRHETEVEGAAVRLILWDLAGQDAYQSVRPAHLRGAAGLLFVVDPTRPGTLDTALELKAMAESAVGETPSLLLLNKEDLADEWLLTDDDHERIRAAGFQTLNTSAKTGANVALAFHTLTARMIAASRS